MKGNYGGVPVTGDENQGAARLVIFETLYLNEERNDKTEILCTRRYVPDLLMKNHYRLSHITGVSYGSP